MVLQKSLSERLLLLLYQQSSRGSSTPVFLPTIFFREGMLLDKMPFNNQRQQQQHIQQQQHSVFRLVSAGVDSLVPPPRLKGNCHDDLLPSCTVNERERRARDAYPCTTHADSAARRANSSRFGPFVYRSSSRSSNAHPHLHDRIRSSSRFLPSLSQQFLLLPGYEMVSPLVVRSFSKEAAAGVMCWACVC